MGFPFCIMEVHILFTIKIFASEFRFITGGTGWQHHTLTHIQNMYLQLGHRDTSTVGASWGSMCTAVGDSTPLDKSEVLGLDRHQQFGLQDLLAAITKKYSIT
jgi:hypothetical protein